MASGNYDFAKPERLSKDEIRTITLLNEEMARNLEASLSGYLRTFTKVALEGVAQEPFSKVGAAFPSPAFLAVVSMQPLAGQALIELSLPIVFCVVDRLLGGAGVTKESRAPTEIESKVMGRILDIVMEALSTAWSHIIPLEPRIESTLTNPQLFKAIAGTDQVAATGFLVELGQVKGYLKLTIPLSALKPVAGKLSVQQWFSGVNAEKDGGRPGEESAAVNAIRVPVACRLGGVSVTLRECTQLKAGDIVKLRPGRLLTEVTVKDRRKFLGVAGVRAGRKAVKITEVKAR